MRRRKSPSPEAASTPASVLAAGSVTVGRFESEDDVILAGNFEGKLHSTRSVQLLAGSQVKGEIHASEIVVQGQVEGNLLARQRIRILEGGNVHGDVCAPQVTVQEGVELNASVRMLGADHETKEYLLPVLLRAEPGSAPRQWQDLLSATEVFLEEIGFQVETRSKPGMLMRSIFRTREPMTYAQFFQRMSEVESALLDASGLRQMQGTDPLPSPATGQAENLLESLGDSEGAVGIFGATVVRVGDMQDGTVQRSIRHRPEILPGPNPAEIPKPGDLLLELQRIQVDVLGETTQTDRIV